MSSIWFIGFQWAVFSTIAMWLGIYIGEQVAKETSFLIAFTLRGIITGILMGVAQWFVLRKYLSSSLRWIPVTVIGWTFAFTLGWAVGFGIGWSIGPSQGWTIGHSIAFVVGGLAGGALACLGQWHILKQQFINSSWLIFVSAISSAIGWFLSWRFDFVHVTGLIGNSLVFAQEGSLAGLLTGSVYGIFTALTIIWIFSNSHTPNILYSGNSVVQVEINRSKVEFFITIGGFIIAILSFMLQLISWLYPNPFN